MYDVLVLSIGQKRGEQIKGNEKICIKKINKSNNKKRKLYHTAWPFINNCNGILYMLYTRDGLGEFECGDDIFEFYYEKSGLNYPRLPYYLLDKNNISEIHSNLIPIKLKEEYSESFEKIINNSIDSSAQKTIMFLCNGDTMTEEIINGVICKKEFMKMLREGNVFTNICYIVSDVCKK